MQGKSLLGLFNLISLFFKQKNLSDLLNLQKAISKPCWFSGWSATISYCARRWGEFFWVLGEMGCTCSRQGSSPAAQPLRARQGGRGRGLGQAIRADVCVHLVWEGNVIAVN